MNRHLPIACLLAACLFLSLPVAVAAESLSPPTQRDLMVELVEGLGWSFGLPDEPTETDYLRILAGQRRLRIEPERLIDNDSPLIPKAIFSYGNYSGDGWLQGPAQPASTTLTFLLPLSGTYRVHARLLRPGFAFGFGQTLLKADGGSRLSDTDCGTVTLSAGPQQLKLDVPARGGIDYIELAAPPLAPIIPPGGWNPSQSLTTGDLASVALQVLERLDMLPEQGKTLSTEAETLPLPKTVLRQTSGLHGAPSGGAWVRAGADPATLRATLPVPVAGIYRLVLRASGQTPITGMANDFEPFTVSPTPTLEELPAGAVELSAGDNLLTIDLPPFAGLDRIDLVPLDATQAGLARLAGLPPDRAPQRADLDRTIRLLAGFGVRR